MQTPLIRPGRVPSDAAGTPPPRIVALFRDAAQGNAVIQLLGAIGVPADQLGVTTPDRMPEGRGMLLSIACPEPALRPRVESICRAQGAELFSQTP